MDVFPLGDCMCIYSFFDLQGFEKALPFLLCFF